MQPSDVVWLKDGSTQCVDDIEIVELPEGEYVAVYNFEVADFHTYFVSDYDVLVHNKCKVDADPAESTTRVHHYTNNKGLEGIKADGKIIARDNGRVYMEPANKKALSPKVAESKYQLKPGRAKNYVEFDVPNSKLEWVPNPRYHTPELTVKGDVNVIKSKYFRRK